MDNASLFYSFLKMIFALAIVLGVLIGGMYFVKKIMQQMNPSSDNQGLINIISSKYMGPKNKIVLVEVLDQLIVLGISNQQMTALSHIDDPLALAKIRAQKTDSGIMDFPGNKLAKYMSRFNLSANRQKDKIEK